MGAQQMSTQTQLWISNKKSILSGEYDHATITSTLNSFSKQNPHMKYRELGIESKVQMNNSKKTILPGFEITLPIQKNVQAMLERCLLGQKNIFPFPVTMRFQKTLNGGVELVIRTKQTPGLEKEAHTPYAVGVNLEQFAKYQVFKGIAEYLALNAVYQFEPDPKWGPVIPAKSAVTGKDQLTVLQATQRTYLPHRKAIDDILVSHLTEPDMQKLRLSFKDTVLRKTQSLKEDISPVLDSPRTKPAPVPQHKVDDSHRIRPKT
jgi:hypothetical protein